jgi:hypothetical protein
VVFHEKEKKTLDRYLSNSSEMYHKHSFCQAKNEEL